MKIVLDTDKKTITVPYNYQEKLDEINRIASEFGGGSAELQTTYGFLQRMWNECMTEPEQHVVVAEKPVRKKPS